ncbi:MAG: hypothetical protein R2744_10360 [Bacteroidales bacterium]
MALIEAQQEIARPTINKILRNTALPTTPTVAHILQVTRIIGSIMIFLVLVTFIVLLIAGRKKFKKEISHE